MDSLGRLARKMTGQQEIESQAIQVQPNVHQSIKKLAAGNERYLKRSAGINVVGDEEKDLRRRLSTLGQEPWAIVISCSDSRCPTERIFDASPGDLFVVRVAGNICGSPIGGVIGSAEYGVAHLGSPIILVLGHTKCGAVSAAVKCCKTCKSSMDVFGRNLGAVVSNISAPADAALLTSERPETPMQIEHAIKLNVFHSMERLIKWSPVIQEALRNDSVEIHGAIYDITTGGVNFLGIHPHQDELIESAQAVVVRTGLDPPMPPHDALLRLQQGNERWVMGNVELKISDEKTRQAHNQKGQRPMAVVLGCADSRIPVDNIFDTNPGDLFVLRNAGQCCGPNAGGLIGSIEYGVSHLKTQFMLVLGHTKCGAVGAAMDAHLASQKPGGDVPEGLKCLLDLLKTPVQMAADRSEGAVLEDKVAMAIELNVWHTIKQLLACSNVIKDLVKQGTLQIHGGVYDLGSGRVRWMGEHPQIKELANVDTDMFDKIDFDFRRDTTALTASTSDTKGIECEPCLPAQVPTPTKGGPNGGPTPVKVVPQPMSIVPNGEPTWATHVQAGGLAEVKGEDDAFFKFSWYVETKNGRQHLKEVVLDPNNWRAGIALGLVSVPLSMSLGVTSGTTPVRGVATAIFGGLCAGVFGSSDYNIVGPAGALSGMMMTYAAEWGQDVLPWLSIMSAVICLLFAILRLDRFMLLMPNSVLEGFSVGVALILSLSQINYACGFTNDEKHSVFISNVGESLGNLGETKAGPLIFFLLQAPTVWLLMHRFPKLPWFVIMAIVAIPLGYLSHHDHLRLDLFTLKNMFGEMKQDDLVVSLKSTDASFGEMIGPAFSIAMVAAVETLISAKVAARRMDRPFKELFEMRGLVLAHAVCGATGAMAPSGFSARANLNAEWGATHRFSQFVNAVVIAVIALALMPVLMYLPQATVAAMIVVLAVRMIPFAYLMKLWNEDKNALMLCLVTAAVCLGQDPLFGLLVGTLLALLESASALKGAKFVSITSKPSASKRAYRVVVNGSLTYANADNFTEKVRKLDNASEIALDLAEVVQSDHDGISAIGKVVDAWTKNDADCMIWIKGVSTELYPSLSVMPWFSKLEDGGKVQKA